MWTVVFVTQDRQMAEKAASILNELKIITRIRTAEQGTSQSGCFEVLVPYAELNEALEAIIEIDA